MTAKRRRSSQGRRKRLVTQTVGSLFPITAILSALAAAGAIVMISLGQPGFAVAAAVLLVIVAAFGTFDTVLARRQVNRHGGDIRAASEDAQDPVPVIPLNEETPYAVTPESNAALPPAQPAQKA